MKLKLNLSLAMMEIIATTSFQVIHHQMVNDSVLAQLLRYLRSVTFLVFIGILKLMLKLISTNTHT